jgi:two-component system LytT family response regulator
MASIPLRVLICDDELMARKRVLRLLGELGGIEAMIECESGEQVLERLGQEEVDIAILDVNMPGLSGIETVMQMPEDRPYIVFLTAHPEHAVKAFEIGAVDYVMKPVDDARLAKALDRARTFLDHGPKSEGGQEPKLAKLAIATHDGAALVSPAEITHATFDGTLVTVHTSTRTILTDDTLQDLEAKLGRAGSFERVHRRAILNLDHVERLESVDSGGYVACLASPPGQSGQPTKRVDVSRQSARKLRRRLGLR